MTTDLLALYETDKAAFILAVADLREQRAKGATSNGYPYVPVEIEADQFGRYLFEIQSAWKDPETGQEGVTVIAEINGESGGFFFPIGDARHDAEHIAAEANPAHALVVVGVWRKRVERHARREHQFGDTTIPFCVRCESLEYVWPYPDLTETADEARAYLGGAA